MAIVEADTACGHPGCLLGNTVAEFGARDPEIEETLGQFLDQFGDRASEVDRGHRRFN